MIVCSVVSPLILSKQQQKTINFAAVTIRKQEKHNNMVSLTPDSAYRNISQQSPTQISPH
jgi:hypothetical protein